MIILALNLQYNTGVVAILTVIIAVVVAAVVVAVVGVAVVIVIAGAGAVTIAVVDAAVVTRAPMVNIEAQRELQKYLDSIQPNMFVSQHRHFTARSSHIFIFFSTLVARLLKIAFDPSVWLT